MEWDGFSFDFRLQMEGLLPTLISIEAYRESATNLVLPSDWSSQLDKLNRVRAVHGTTALEGNPLSEAEVSLQIDMIDAPTLAPANKLTKEQRQIRNSGLAQSWVKDRFSPECAPLQIGDILYMHRTITEASDEMHNVPGSFRTFPVVVGSPELGGVHKGAPHHQLDILMAKYIDFINSRRMRDTHPVIAALLAHFFLVTIHPFGDGNGRVSRLVEAAILYQWKYNVFGFYGLSNYFYRHEAGYKTILQESRMERPFDVTPLIRFGLAGFAEELKGINNFIKSKLNRVVYRAMLVRAFNQKTGERRRIINQREYSLLDYLISETEPIDPFSENPSRQITITQLRNNAYVAGSYSDVTPRTFLRELTRLSDFGFIKFNRAPPSPENTIELDFGAIGKY
jgi:Fic family protein